MSNAFTGRLKQIANAIYNGGIADSFHKLILPQNTTVKLAEIVPQEKGSLAYDTTLNEVVVNNGSSFSPVSSGSSGTVTSVGTGTGLTGGPITTSGTISLAPVAHNRVLANLVFGSAAPIPNTISDIIDSGIDNTQGDILYRNAFGWTWLDAGVSGQFLQTQGPSADVQWADVDAANRNLSNLSNPIAINEDLKPATNNARALGDNNHNFANVFSRQLVNGNVSDSLNIKTFNASGVALSSGNISIQSGNAEDTLSINSGSVTLLSGNSDNANSGSINLISGNAPNSGSASGNISFTTGDADTNSGNFLLQVGNSNNTAGNITFNLATSHPESAINLNAQEGTVYLNGGFAFDATLGSVASIITGGNELTVDNLAVSNYLRSFPSNTATLGLANNYFPLGWIGQLNTQNSGVDNASIDVLGGFLYDFQNPSFKSMDYKHRQLLANNGSTVMMDWTSTSGVDFNGNKISNVAIESGNTASRPASPIVGQMYFDTTITRPIWYSGTNWINAAGAVV